MGFIEELKTQKLKEKEIAEKEAKAAKERSEKLKVDEEEKKRLELRTSQEDKQKIKDRLELSREALIKSKLPELIGDMHEIIDGSIIRTTLQKDGWIDLASYYSITKWSEQEIEDGKSVSESDLGKREGLNLATAPISEHAVEFFGRHTKEPIVGMMLAWYVGSINQDHSPYGGYSYDSQYNVVPVTCDSEGTITIGMRKIRKKFLSKELISALKVPSSEWRDAPHVLEAKIKEAYENPRIFLVNHSGGQWGNPYDDRPGG